MGLSRRVGWALVCFMILLLEGGAPAAASPGDPASPVDTGRLDRFVTEQMDRHGIPGLSLALIQDSHVSYVQGYGNAGDGRRMTATTPLPIASMTKPFTAVAVLQLADAGLLDLDAPVQRYLPSFEVADPAASRTITVRQLLQHTSGLSDLGYRRLLPADATLDDGVRDLRSARLTARPGEAHQYFNPNYAVLARMVEEVTGRPFAEVVQGRILGPLGMTGSTTDPAAAGSDQARGYVKLFGWALKADAPVRHHRDGADNVVATAPDLARFAIAVGLPPGEEPALLSATSWTAMATPAPIEGVTYGLGWDVTEHRGERVVGHDGLDPTFSGQMAVLPERGAGYVLLTNQGHLLETMMVGPQLRHGLLDLLTGREPSGGGVAWRLVGVLLLAGFAVTTFFSVRGLVRLPESVRTLPTPPRARRAWRVGSHFLTATLLLLLMYRVVPALIGRTYNLREVGLYHLPDITLLVAVSVLADFVAGVVLLGAWVAFAARVTRPPTAAAR